MDPGKTPFDGSQTVSETDRGCCWSGFASQHGADLFSQLVYVGLANLTVSLLEVPYRLTVRRDMDQA
jgi:hypothetical protein